MVLQIGIKLILNHKELNFQYTIPYSRLFLRGIIFCDYAREQQNRKKISVKILTVTIKTVKYFMVQLSSPFCQALLRPVLENMQPQLPTRRWKKSPEHLPLAR